MIAASVGQFDQWQKQTGLPTSADIEKQEILQKIMALVRSSCEPRDVIFSGVFVHWLSNLVWWLHYRTLGNNLDRFEKQQVSPEQYKLMILWDLIMIWFLLQIFNSLACFMFTTNFQFCFISFRLDYHSSLLFNSVSYIDFVYLDSVNFTKFRFQIPLSLVYLNCFVLNDHL